MHAGAFLASCTTYKKFGQEFLYLLIIFIYKPIIHSEGIRYSKVISKTHKIEVEILKSSYTSRLYTIITSPSIIMYMTINKDNNIIIIKEKQHVTSIDKMTNSGCIRLMTFYNLKKNCVRCSWFFTMTCSVKSQGNSTDSVKSYSRIYINQLNTDKQKELNLKEISK